MFRTVLAVWAVALALTQGIIWHTTHALSFALLLVFLLLGGCLWGVLFRYFQRQSALLEQAVQQIQSCLDGNPDARLEEKENLTQLYREIGESYERLDKWSMYLITSYEKAENDIGRKADKNRKIYNGMLKTYYYQFLGPRPPKKNRS